MEEQDRKRRREEVERAAENVWLRLLARYSMVVLLPAMVTLVGLLAVNIWDTQQKSMAIMTNATNENTRAITRLENMVDNLIKTEFPYAMRELKGQIDALNVKVTTQSIDLKAQMQENDEVNKAQHDTLMEHDREIRSLQWRMNALKPSPEERLERDQKNILRRGGAR